MVAQCVNASARHPRRGAFRPRFRSRHAPVAHSELFAVPAHAIPPTPAARLLPAATARSPSSAPSGTDRSAPAPARSRPGRGSPWLHNPPHGPQPFTEERISNFAGVDAAATAAGGGRSGGCTRGGTRAGPDGHQLAPPARQESPRAQGSRPESSPRRSPGPAGTDDGSQGPSLPRRRLFGSREPRAGGRSRAGSGQRRSSDTLRRRRHWAQAS